MPSTLKKQAKPAGRPLGGPPSDRPRGMEKGDLVVTVLDTVEAQEDLLMNLEEKKLLLSALVVYLASVVVLVALEHQLVQTMLKCNDFRFSSCSFGCH